MSLFFSTHLGQPIPQSRARVTRNGTFYAANATKHRAELAWSFKADHAGRAPLKGPLRVTLTFRGMRATSDLDNLAKLVLDSLQDAGVIATDDVRTIKELVLHAMEGPAMTITDIEAANAPG